MTEHITRLDSGLTIATDRVLGARSVAIGVWIPVGSRDETPERSGVSHFLEHLLFKGTPTRSATDISRLVDRLGGDINAFTSKEYTAYYCRLPARHGAIGIEVLGDVLTHATLSDSDVESERQVILEELAMDDDAPDDVALRVLTGCSFPDHGLGRDTAGERDTVRQISADDVRQFYAAHYSAPGAVVALAGELDHDEVVTAVEAAFADLPAHDGRIARTVPGGAARGERIDDDCEQVHLAVGGRALPREHPDREVLDVLNHVFGGGLSSRLFDEVRERRGLAYSIYSSASAYADAGMWSVYAGSMPEHAGEVEQVVLAETARLAAGGITADELEIAVGYLTGAYELGLEDSGARMSRLGGMLATVGSVRPVDEQLARWEAVTLDDAARVATEVYGTAAPIVVAVGPQY